MLVGERSNDGSVDFGFALIGKAVQPPQRSLLVKNTSLTTSGPLSVAVTGDFVVVNDQCSGQPLAPGLSCSIRVRAAPTEAGWRTGTLTVRAMPGGEASTILTVAANYEEADVVLPSSLDFGSVEVGTTSDPRSVLFEGRGQWRLSIAGASPEDFVISNDLCSDATLPLYAKCEVQVSFRPTRPEAFRAALKFESLRGGDSVTLSVALSGKGHTATAHLQTDPGVVDFGTPGIQCVNDRRRATVKVHNVGRTPTGALALAVAEPFAVLDDDCQGRVLAPDASCSVQVVFLPTRSEPASGALAISASPGGTAGTILKAVGLNADYQLEWPPSVDYGRVALGAMSAPRIFTIHNPTTEVLNKLSAGFEGANVDEFAIVRNTCPIFSSADQTCALEVVFKPTRIGPSTATLRGSSWCARASTALLGEGY